MKDYGFTVGGHFFSVLVDDSLDLSAALAHYAPFASATEPMTAPATATMTAPAPVFRLHVVPEADLSEPEGLTEEFNQDDDGSQIRISRTRDGQNWLAFSLRGSLSGRMLAAADFSEATLSIHAYDDFALSNALMVQFAMATAPLRTALFHAAVIGFQGKGYLFLGKSGTGKSTHARLWLKHIAGSELVNDDNPVVRILEDGAARVYGSPWSGKTPCYRNIDLPVGGVVLLAQAPYNAIRRLRGIAAYAALVPSISGKRWDKAIADGLHETENALASTVPVWHLDCLPDEAAARLSATTLTGSER